MRGCWPARRHTGAVLWCVLPPQERHRHTATRAAPLATSLSRQDGRGGTATWQEIDQTGPIRRQACRIIARVTPYTTGITPGLAWLILAVGLLLSGLVIYTAVRIAILHSFAVMEREKAAAKRDPARPHVFDDKAFAKLAENRARPSSDRQ